MDELDDPPPCACRLSLRRSLPILRRRMDATERGFRTRNFHQPGMRVPALHRAFPHLYEGFYVD